MKLAFKVFLLISVILATACAKEEGPGGNTTIATLVRHHDKKIPGATIYVKYGAVNSPGENLSSYDDSRIADAEGHAHFEELQPGDYYFFSIGYDSTIALVVKGGTYFEIIKKDKGQHLDVIVPVTED